MLLTKKDEVSSWLECVLQSRTLQAQAGTRMYVIMLKYGS